MEESGLPRSFLQGLGRPARCGTPRLQAEGFGREVAILTIILIIMVYIGIIIFIKDLIIKLLVIIVLVDIIIIVLVLIMPRYLRGRVNRSSDPERPGVSLKVTFAWVTLKKTNIQGVSKKSEFSRNWLQEILPGSVRNPVGIIRTNPALLQYVSHFIHHLECVGYMQILFSQFSLGFQQTVTRLGHNYITCDKIPILGNPIVSLVSE